MRRNIGLLLTYYDQVELGTLLSDITIGCAFRFNSREVNLLGAMHDYAYDAIILKLTHPEFDVVSEGCMMPFYHIDEARKRYPFLFTDTNPILYRKF